MGSSWPIPERASGWHCVPSMHTHVQFKTFYMAEFLKNAIPILNIL